jgi:hypothetical protein
MTRVRAYWQPRRYFPLDLKAEETFFLLRRGVLRMVYRRPFKTRHTQMAGMIAEAIDLAGYASLPVFYVMTGDLPARRRVHRRTRFSQCGHPGSLDVAAPDFVFTGWAEARFTDFDMFAAELHAASQATAADDRAFWAGRRNTEARRRLVELGQEHPALICAVPTESHYDSKADLYTGAFLSLAEQAERYRFLIDVDGSGWSGRFKLLLHSGRVVLKQRSDLYDYFMPDIQPFRHYVPVASDMSDLVERIEWLKANPEREKEIAAEAQDFAKRRLTKKAAVEHWAMLLEKHKQAGGLLRPADLERKSKPDAPC